MSKKQQKEKNSEGLKLVGNTSELIGMMIADPEERTWASEQIENHGPAHKQVLSALMLKRILKLIKTIEKSTGVPFVLQDGYELTIEKDKKSTVLPINIPIITDPGKDKMKIAEAICEAPRHEALTFAICLQSLEWAIKTMIQKPKNNV